MRYGELAVTKRQGNKWVCLCDCGRTTLASNNDLVTGKATHCGCKDAPAELPWARRGIPDMTLAIRRDGERLVCVVGSIDGVPIGAIEIEALREVVRQWDAAEGAR